MIIMLMGPTATGKTEIALELVEEFPLEIISVDSALVYRGMDIGTAKPSQAILNQVPHHLINILSPEENYSVGHFLQDATQAIQQIQRRGKIPLLVGGTMLYFKAFLEGLADLPPVPSDIRSRLAKALSEEGLASLYQRLQGIDPHAASRIHGHDTQRILRALAVYEASGQPLSDWLSASVKEKSVEKIVQISLMPEDRIQLHERLAQRFHHMLHQGLVDEVKNLKDHYQLTAVHSSMRCVGYRQVWQYVSGEIDYDTMREKAIVVSRQLAKRQLTWLRSWPAHYRISAYQPDTVEKVKLCLK